MTGHHGHGHHGQGHGHKAMPMTGVAADVADQPVMVADVDRREAVLRATPQAVTLPAADSSEGRQLRRWLTQVLVAERVIAVEAAARGLTAERAPGLAELLPDTMARIEIGSVPAAVLEAGALARALFAEVTAEVGVPAAMVREYYDRNRVRFARPARRAGGWDVYRQGDTAPAPPFAEVAATIERELTGSARRLAFRRWLDQRTSQLVRLRPGYEHPADPRQPDNTHRH